MRTTSLPALGVAMLFLGGASVLLIQHQSLMQQRSEIQRLLGQIEAFTDANESLSNRAVRSNQTRSLELPTRPVAGVQSAALFAPEKLGTTNLYAFMTNKSVKLPVSQLGHYLESNQRSAASLLAAFRTTGESELLEEAVQKSPNNPLVNFEAALRMDAPLDERRHWLDSLKDSAPENAVANYLSAADYFRNGQIDRALQELVVASGKPEFKDYTLERVQDDEEAFRAAGYSVAESQLLANQHLVLPQLLQVKELSSQMLALADSYRQNGDKTAWQTVTEMVLNLGRRYDEFTPGEPLISQLVGVAVEHTALAAMDPQTTVDGSGQTAQERLDQLTQTRNAIQELSKQADPIWHAINDQDWINYHSRSLAFGERAALQWLVGKGTQP